MTQFTKGPWVTRSVFGWGDEPCILTEGEEKPFAKLIRPDGYYTEYVKRTDENGDVYTVLSDRAAQEAGNYVPTKEHKDKVNARQWADAHLMAASLDLFNLSLKHEARLRHCANNIEDEFPLWAGDLIKMANELLAAIAKAEGKT